MVVGPGVVADAAVDGVVGVSGALGAELPDGPVVAVLGVEEGDELVEGVSVRPLGVRLGRAGPVGARRGVSGGVDRDDGVGEDGGCTDVAMMSPVT